MRCQTCWLLAIAAAAHVSSPSAYSVDVAGFRVLVDRGPQEIAATPDARTVLLRNQDTAWGTGEHATTALCIEFLKHRIQGNELVVDYGTGSGVLSIVAAKLGARLCIGVDIDDEILAAARINTELNGVADRVTLFHHRSVMIGEIPRANLTVANILTGPLTRLAPVLWSCTSPGGLMCLSGLRPEHVDAVLRVYAPFIDMNHEDSGVSVRDHQEFGEWARIVGRTKIMDCEEEQALFRAMSDNAV